MRKIHLAPCQRYWRYNGKWDKQGPHLLEEMRKKTSENQDKGINDMEGRAEKMRRTYKKELNQV